MGGEVDIQAHVGPPSGLAKAASTDGRGAVVVGVAPDITGAPTKTDALILEAVGIGQDAVAVVRVADDAAFLRAPLGRRPPPDVAAVRGTKASPDRPRRETGGPRIADVAPDTPPGVGDVPNGLVGPVDEEVPVVPPRPDAVATVDLVTVLAQATRPASVDTVVVGRVAGLVVGLASKVGIAPGRLQTPPFPRPAPETDTAATSGDGDAPAFPVTLVATGVGHVDTDDVLPRAV